MKEVFDRIASSWSGYRIKPQSFVIDYLKDKSGLLLVEGCGSGRHSVYASKQGLKVIGFDYSIEMIKLAKSKDPTGSYLVADARALPFKDKVFDHSISIAVLHHIKPSEVPIALSELKRVTKNGLLISVWLHPELKGEQLIKWGKEERYYYLYESNEFKRLVSHVFKEIKAVPDKDNIVLEVS